MKRISVVAVAALVLSSLGLAFAPANAIEPSQGCTDGSPTFEKGVVLLEWPVFVAARVFPQTNPASVGVCYRTPASPGTAGGWVVADAQPASSGYGASGRVSCTSDTGVRQPVTCSTPYSASAVPTFSTSSGTVTVSVPIGICLGVCAAGSPNVAKTGVVVGTLTPTTGPAGSYGHGYAVSSVEVYLDGNLLLARNGQEVAGTYIGWTWPPPSLVSTPTVGAPTPPCVVGGVCTPTFDGKLAFNGYNNTVTVLLPTGASSYPVTLPAKCLVNFDGPC